MSSDKDTGVDRIEAIAREVVDAFSRRPPRDPARIEAVLAEIRKAWYSYPDLRFHQLMAAAQPASAGQDLFYQEDDTLLADLRKFNASDRG